MLARRGVVPRLDYSLSNSMRSKPISQTNRRKPYESFNADLRRAGNVADILHR
jgi:hypothetical protein